MAHPGPPPGTASADRRAGLAAVGVDASLASAQPGQSVTYCFLDDDPVATAERLRPVLEDRWTQAAVEPLLAAPFYPVVPYEWDRYVP